jgi:3-phenylpropionate/trans-cinnamate dioxygenase ferredoxin subunit
MPITITVRKNGPYAVPAADLELVDHEGNRIPLPEGKTTITLCRCGASTRKPFCDGTHSKIGFQAAQQAQQAFDAAQQQPAAPPASGSQPVSPPAPQQPAPPPAVPPASTPKP